MNEKSKKSKEERKMKKEPNDPVIKTKGRFWNWMPNTVHLKVEEHFPCPSWWLLTLPARSVPRAKWHAALSLSFPPPNLHTPFLSSLSLRTTTTTSISSSIFSLPIPFFLSSSWSSFIYNNGLGLGLCSAQSFKSKVIFPFFMLQSLSLCFFSQAFLPFFRFYL